MHPKLSRNLFAIVTSLAMAVCITDEASAHQWQRLGPEGGQVLSMAVAKDGTVYLGTPDGHVFASQNRAGHWELRGRAGGRPDSVIQALIADSRVPDRLYAGVWYLNPSAGGGVFESDDGGRNWAPAGLRGEAVRALNQSSLRPEVLVAGTRSGVFQTRDAGRQWHRISAAADAELRNIDSVAVDPQDAAVIYAGTYHLPWKTMDGGTSWFPIHSGMIDDSDVMSLQIDSQDPDRVFASACSGIYRSGDGGASWTKLQGIPYSSRRTQQILQDSLDPRVLYAATTEGLWISRDGGENWTRATPRDWVVNAVAALPSDQGTRILLGTDARGILASDDAGKSFFSANAGFSHRVVSSMAADPKAVGHLLIQMTDSPRLLFETHDGGRSWTLLPGPLPSAGVDRLFGTAAGWWASLPNGGALRYDAGLRQWRALRFANNSPISRRNQRDPPAAANTPKVLQIAERADRIYLSTTDGVWIAGSQRTVLDRFEPKQLAGTVFDISFGRQICALVEKRIVCSRHGRDFWERVQQPPGAKRISWIRSFGDGPNDTLFAGTDRGVFQTDGLTPESWHLVQSGLPVVGSEPPVVSGRLLGIAMANGGFYVSEDAGKTWARADTANQTGATKVAADGRGGFEVASRTEGMLHWIP